MGLLNCLKSILRTRIQNGTIKRNPYDQFPLTQKPVQRDFLEKEEIERLQALKDLMPAQDINNNLLLFACFTGLAYTDIKGFKGTDIITDPKFGWIKKFPKKRNSSLKISTINSWFTYKTDEFRGRKHDNWQQNGFKGSFL